MIAVAEEGIAVGVFIVELLVLSIIGIISAVIASKRGRSPVGWFFAGFFLGLVGLIIILVLPNPKAEKAQKEYADRENRRLREQLRQEQIKSETFRQYATQRIDTHDDALGMDTRHASQTALPGQAQTMMLEQDNGDALAALTAGNQQPIQAAVVPPPMSGAQPSSPAGAIPKPPRQWFYELNGASMGPVSTDAVKILIQQGRILSDTLVWTDSLTEWTPARRISIFKPLVAPV